MMVFTAAVLLAACARDIQNSEAVRQGVVDYLKARTAQTGLDVNLLQVDVTSVSFEKEQARAMVAIRPKAGGEPMMMNYAFERKGDKWVVKPREGATAHPNTATPDGESMPPGHPAVGGQAAPGTPGALPPGHPPVGSKP
jgi:hypothetical protein